MKQILQDRKIALALSDQTLDKVLLKWQYKKTFALFHKMAKSIPAYINFLKTSKIKPAQIKSSKDLVLVPYVDKNNYFRFYPIQKKLWPKFLEKQALVGTATSGSTGKPTYFLRSKSLDWKYSLLAEYFLNHSNNGPTLLINCFGMGVWIGGLITYQAFYDAANRGNPLSIMTPGINKKEIFNTLRELAPAFKTIIFAGYPPFIKDIIDEAEGEGCNLNKWQVRFVFAAESFTEDFRDYITTKSKTKNVYLDTMNIYGTAELGAMAFETPTSILVRRLVVKNPVIYSKLFKNGKLPTLCQYNPEFIAFDQMGEELLVSADSAIPVLRYKLGDNGGVFNLTELLGIFKDAGIDLNGEAKKHGINLSPLPFVYVYERSDFSVTLYGLQIYPQSIKRAIESTKLFKFVTGKFTLETCYDAKSNQYLKINLELKPNAVGSQKLEKTLLKCITNHLLKENSEYRELSNMLESARTRPRLKFWPYNDEKYFKSGVKQQWRR